VWLLHNAVPEPDVVEFKVDPQAARESLAKKFHVEHRQIQELARISHSPSHYPNFGQDVEHKPDERLRTG